MCNNTLFHGTYRDGCASKFVDSAAVGHELTQEGRSRHRSRATPSAVAREIPVDPVKPTKRATSILHRSALQLRSRESGFRHAPPLHITASTNATVRREEQTIDRETRGQSASRQHPPLSRINSLIPTRMILFSSSFFMESFYTAMLVLQDHSEVRVLTDACSAELQLD